LAMSLIHEEVFIGCLSLNEMLSEKNRIWLIW
jgi:hypothetical protein